jgi:hypothetical protein
LLFHLAMAETIVALLYSNCCRDKRVSRFSS